MARTIYGDHERFMATYLKPFAGTYFTGDGAIRDKDGFYWITGRVDDVINVSGHRMGSAEIESALVANAKVAEAAVRASNGVRATTNRVHRLTASAEMSAASGARRACA